MKCLPLICIFFSTSALTQNIVPNGSFESYRACPGNFSQSVNHFEIPAWVSTGTGTPDHYHSCSEGDADVPYNWAGVADAFDGKGYAGIFLWMKDKDYREYIQCRLTEPLMKDSVYHVQFHYKLSSYSKFSIDRIGLNFSQQQITSNDDKTISLIPTLAIVHDSALTKQTGTWELARMKYKASGNEAFLTIGNFWKQDDVHAYQIQFRPVSEPMLANASYYYIDDVQVIPDSYLKKQEKLIQPVEFEHVKANTNYVLKNIRFEFDSYRLLNASFEELDQLAMFLMRHPSVKIQIFGHTDDLGGPGYNQRLSERRARNVGDYLVSIGVQPDRVETFGFGKSKPLLKEMTEEARKMNRRVEIRFLE